MGRVESFARAAELVDAQAREASRASAVVLLNGAHLTPEPIQWLWEGWLALGKFAVLAGPPGCGKTTIALAMAAVITSAGRWPDGHRAPQGSVLVWSGEDDPSDTLLPRLIAVGADRSKVYFVTGSRVDGEMVPFDPARDLVQLAAEADRIGDVRLLLVDPVVSVVTGDSHKNTEVRRALQPLVDLGSRIGAAVLGISHFSKGSSGRDPTERVTGSVAFGAVARIVMVAAKVTDEDGEVQRVLARSKSNIGPDDGGFEYSLEQVEVLGGIQASRVMWGKALPGNARDLLREDEVDADGATTSDVDRFLVGVLANGPLAAKTVFNDAREAGYAQRTIQRAANRLGVSRTKEGMAGGWVWRLDGRRHEGAVGATFQTVASSASSGVAVAPSDNEESF